VGKDKTIWMQLESFPPSPTTPFKHGNVHAASKLKKFGIRPLSSPYLPLLSVRLHLCSPAGKKKYSIPWGIVPAMSLAQSIARGGGSPKGNFFS